MNNTNNFDLALYEGQDIFNPLVVENENMELIDAQLKVNEEHTIGEATELKSSDVHAILRTTPDAPFFRFTATSDYEIGDSFTVDGLAVTAKMPNGEAIPDRAFVVNSTVLCSLIGQLLTIYTSGNKEADNAKKLEGHPASYFAKASDLSGISDTADSAYTLANQAVQKLGRVARLFTGNATGTSSPSGGIDFGEIVIPEGINIIFFRLDGSGAWVSFGFTSGLPNNDVTAFRNGYNVPPATSNSSDGNTYRRVLSTIYSPTSPTTLHMWAWLRSVAANDTFNVAYYIINLPRA